MKRYAISDIHGCAKTFKALLKHLQFSKEDELYLLGDYIDRGPDSKGVIDHIWQLQEEGYFVRCLRGNHEQMLVDEVKKEHFYKGNVNMLQSFGVSSNLEVPMKYIEWMDNLDYYFEVDNYILVHAGLNFNSAKPLEDLTAMLWIRHWTQDINHDWLGDRIIIHGHTPTKKLEMKQYNKTLDSIPAMVIDNGCVFEHIGLGSLVAFDLDSRKLHFYPRIESK